MLLGLFAVSAAAAGPTADVTFTFSERGIAVSDESAEGYKIAGSS